MSISKMPEEGDFYFNAEGLMVFTRQYHLKRGFCCGSGCIHCPYNWERVASKEKARLLMQREKYRKDQK